MINTKQDIAQKEDSTNFKKALEWEKRMIEKGHYREHFFKIFAEQINKLFNMPVSILEIGSGPGHLAERLIQTNKVKKYTLFDLSKAMHQIASKRLNKYQSITEYKVGSFLEKQCFDDLGQYDIVVCMQSIHEVRDKTLAVEIYKNIINVIKPHGYFLVCDFVIGDPGMEDTSMYMTEKEQEDALLKSGFTSVKLITSHLGLTLFSAQKIDDAV